MPAKKSGRAKRKGARRAKRRGQALTTINRSLQPFANRYICKMKYAATVQTGFTGQFLFNLNSVWDPDRTGTGHQAYGFDSMALIYNRYRVVSCGWRIQAPLLSSANPVTVACIASNDTSINWPDSGVMLENPRAKYITQNPGAATTSLSGKVYLPKLAGRTKTQYMADDQYQSNVLGNPTESMLLYIQTFAAVNGFQASAVPLQVVLEYTVEWFDSKHLPQS